MCRNTTTAEEEEVDLGLGKLKQAVCVKSGKKKQKRKIIKHCGHYTKGAKHGQQNLHERVVLGGVLHLILLELVFNLDSFTHMHVQGMFATEEFSLAQAAI